MAEDIADRTGAVIVAAAKKPGVDTTRALYVLVRALNDASSRLGLNVEPLPVPGVLPADLNARMLKGPATEQQM